MSLKKHVRETNKNYVYKYVWMCSQMTPNKFSIKNLSNTLGVSSASVLRYLSSLVDEGKVKKIDRNRYAVVDKEYEFEYCIPFPSEDKVWSREIADKLEEKFSRNAIANANYVFTEMFNNAVEHSEGSHIRVVMRINDFQAMFIIGDDGVGIFEKIKQKAGLEEKRYAVLELAKGKFTADPSRHSGEGIFFSSKIADSFLIMSDNLTFAGQFDQEKGLLMDNYLVERKGTIVAFSIKNPTKNNAAKIFSAYCNDPNSFGFDKTVVSVRLLEEGAGCPMFTSRSQAKRLMARLDRFKSIILDFSEIKSIGQGFADEIFRVFANEHKDCEIRYINENKDVGNMIKHILGTN